MLNLPKVKERVVLGLNSDTQVRGWIGWLARLVGEKSIERYSSHSRKNPRVLRIFVDKRHLSTKI